MPLSLLKKRALPYARFFRWVILAAIFAYLGRMVWGNWNEVREVSFTLSPLHLFLSTLFSVFWYLIQIAAWYLITLRLGIAIPLLETFTSWYYSQLGKYLPGKVWLFLGRFYFYDSEGKSRKALTVALYFETLTMIMAAGLVFLFSLLFLKEVKPFYPGISPLGLVLIFAVAFLFLHPRVLEALFNRILRYLKREPIVLAISYPEVLGILGVCVLSWVAGGLGFYFFVDGVFPVSARSFLFLTGALAISSTLGLVALFAPSGLGVREGVLVYLLSTMMPPPVAVILSVLTRLWMTFIEIAMIGVVYLVDKLQRKGPGEG